MQEVRESGDTREARHIAVGNKAAENLAAEAWAPAITVTADAIPLRFGDPYSASQKAWHPAEKGSDEDQQWQRLSKEQESKSIELDAVDIYTVQRGDCLSTIAARLLKANGEAASRQAINKEMQELLKLNPQLKGNPDLVIIGQELLTKDWNKAAE